MGWFKHHLEPKLTGLVGAGKRSLWWKFPSTLHPKVGQIICDVHQVGGALTSYFSQDLEKPRWYFIFAAEASLVLRLSSGSYATPGLLNCAPALDPWCCLRKWGEAMSAVSGTSGVQFFLEAGVFYRLEWLDDRGMVTKRATFYLVGLWGEYHVVFVPGPERKFHWVEGENSFSMKNIPQQTESLPLKTGLLPPKRIKGGCLPTIQSVSGVSCFRVGIYYIWLVSSSLKPDNPRRTQSFVRLGHLNDCFQSSEDLEKMW